MSSRLKYIQPETKQKILLLVMLSMMSVISLLASDIYLPAMPNIAHSLNAQETDIQFTLTVYLFGLSICQLIYGPLSDTFGRRRILIIGITTFVLASLACSLSTTANQLIAARFFQALGACSGMVIGRAIAGDLYTREEAAKIFTAIFPIVGASSAIAPIIGGYLTDWFGWPTCFLFLSFFGITLLFMVIFFLVETKRSTEVATKVNKFTEMLHILKNHSFIGFSLVVSSVYAAYFAYIASTPFLFNRYGFTSYQIGYFFILLSILYIAANLISRRLINHYPINHIITFGIVLFILGSFSMVCVALIGTHNNPYALIIPMSVMTAGNGFLLPLGVASTVTLFPSSAGTSSGLMGFLQLTSASLSVGTIGHLTNNQELPIAIFIFLISLIAVYAFYYYIYRGETYAGSKI